MKWNSFDRFKELDKTKTPVVVNDRLKIKVRCFEISNWRSFNVLVGMLSRPVDLLVLGKEITLKISSSVIWAKMMATRLLGDKKSEKYLLENFILDCTFWSAFAKRSLKTLSIKRGSAIKFTSWVISVGESLLPLVFVMPFQVFLMSLLLLLKNSLKYCCLEFLKEGESKF